MCYSGKADHLHVIKRIFAFELVQNRHFCYTGFVLLNNNLKGIVFLRPGCKYFLSIIVPRFIDIIFGKG
jgi:hypothetical protein